MAVSTNSSSNKTFNPSDFVVRFLPIRQLPCLPTANAAGKQWSRRTSLPVAIQAKFLIQEPLATP